MRNLLKGLLCLFTIVLCIEFLIIPPADKNTRTKVKLIEDQLSKNGLYPKWIIISKKRYKWYNSILKNSSKDSYHLKGKAIDIFVFDINNDGHFNQVDIDYIKEANKEVEREHPDMIGAIGTYTNKKYPTNRMVHIDTRGYKKYYNY